MDENKQIEEIEEDIVEDSEQVDADRKRLSQEVPEEDEVDETPEIDLEEEARKAEEKDRKRAHKERVNNITTLALFLILVIGVCIILYPTFSNWWNSMHASQAIASYVEAVENYNDEELQVMLDEASAYNTTLEAGVNFIDTEERHAEYERLLDISGTGIMGYVSIPAIDVNLPIYHGTSEAVLQIAAGHLEGSSLPVGGESTHSVISGHRGLPSAKLFTDLDELVVGDTFTISILKETITYRVDQISVVVPEDVSGLSIESGKDYCTLVTCTPYGINTHRMLVRGHRVENEAEELVVIITPDATKVPANLVAFMIALPLLIIAVILYMIFTSMKRKPATSREIMRTLKEKGTLYKK